MNHMIIGLIVGIIMGLTGAGGALISIPLFIWLLDSTLKQATILSLVAVALGTSMNLIGKFSEIDYKTVLAFAIFGGLANYLSLPLKAITPDLMMALLLGLVGLYGIVSVWNNKFLSEPRESKPHFFKYAITGIGLGIITTLTGLGGGVVLVPILVKIFGKSYEKAIPTSLATIFLISLMSFITQFNSQESLIAIKEIGFIAAGALVAYYSLKVATKKLSPRNVDQIRKVVFTLVTVYSVGSVVVKAL